jgi:hypothetical protein
MAGHAEVRTLNDWEQQFYRQLLQGEPGNLEDEDLEPWLEEEESDRHSLEVALRHALVESERCCGD